MVSLLVDPLHQPQLLLFIDFFALLFASTAITSFFFKMSSLPDFLSSLGLSWLSSAIFTPWYSHLPCFASSLLLQFSFSPSFFLITRLPDCLFILFLLLSFLSSFSLLSTSFCASLNLGIIDFHLLLHNTLLLLLLSCLLQKGYLLNHNHRGTGYIHNSNIWKKRFFSGISAVT